MDMSCALHGSGPVTDVPLHVWGALLAYIDVSGVAMNTVVLIARTLVGYQISQKNEDVAEDEEVDTDARNRTSNVRQPWIRLV